MDTLPVQGQSPPSQPPQGGSASPVGSMAKESAPIPSQTPEAPPVTEIGKEVELTPEVSGAGVKIQSDTIVLPKPVQQMGVKTVGPAAPVQAAAPAITLPLTDDQIAQGLHQSIQSSWRWLAEWCRRQLAGVHMTIKTMGGKAVRTRAD